MTDSNSKYIFPHSAMYKNEKERGDDVYLRQPINDEFIEYTWKEVMDKARRIATFLMAQGFKKGDRIAILSKNCAEWIITDFGIILAGMVTVPIYATQNKDDIKFVLEHSGSKAIFIGKLDNFEIQEDGVPDNLLRIDFPYQHWEKSKYTLEEIFAKYEPMNGEPLPHEDDLFTIMYTSGTTGFPKGVMLTYKANHRFIEHNTKDMESFDMLEHEHFISYLPLAHSFERSVIELLSISMKSDISFVESIEKFPDNLRSISPTIFQAVPRIWTIFRQRILEKLPQKKLDTLLKIPGVSWLIKHKIKKALGLSRAHLCLSGAAPIPRATLEWYDKIGIHITEGYGSTENTSYATANKPGETRAGSIGKPRYGVELKVDENNELLIKSPGDMIGYYKDEELTEKTIDKDGFIHTGDMAHIDNDGFVFILGRVKEQFKTSKGEFITPVPIENQFAKNHDIEQCCLIGHGLRQPILLASLSESARKKEKSDIEKELLETLESVDEDLTNYEKVSHIYIVKDEWSTENDLLTPTQKMKRHVIQERYGKAVNDLQNEDKKIAWE